MAKLFCVLFAFILAFVAVDAHRNFLSHCDAKSLFYQSNTAKPNPYVLSALCGGKWLKINLNACVSNNDGDLEWNKETPNYAASCTKCYIRTRWDRLEFTCIKCRMEDGKNLSNSNNRGGPSLVLNNGIGLVNGQLAC
ncbi:hypothetical protein DSL72_004853 [Monilinia vaccinii-corymbosi]|uniref:Cyanovirin-N domain-containing protein n=1 Tax=Monilinia vaccinii-corymbosi TaxID=61207 RepID=A0A8A3P5G2_9HELO|nr:hypothetical protein DSL72_004853 [Monilinia vaccinii-corymbosi]